MNERISLDIGCGKRNNLSYYGFDGPVSAALDINKGFLRSRRDGVSTSYLQGDGEFLPFKSSVGDHVFAIHYLEHVDDYEDAMDELSRITKEGGVLTIAVPHPNYESVMSKMDPEYHSPRMHQRVLPGGILEKDLKERGFKIVEMQKRGSVQAMLTTAMYFLHRKLLRDQIMESHSGHLVKGKVAGKHSDSENSFMTRLKRILKSSRLSRIFKLSDKIYPFETYVVAQKLTNPSETPGLTS